MDVKINNCMDLFTIGSNLREMREAKKVTQLQVVEALNVSYTHYAKIEEGIRGMSLPMLFKLMVLSGKLNDAPSGRLF